MIYEEVVRYLPTVPNQYYLCHCVSTDFEMGAGIVVQFRRIFDMRRKLYRDVVT